ncbi:MAG: dihydropyrimidinase, partial [Acidimicrobiales bacterium]
MRLAVTGGTVVSATGSAPADVLVEDEAVVALVAPGSELAEGWLDGSGWGPLEGSRRIDASGRLVVPGGIDGHTHMEMPFGGTFSVDTFET